MARDKGEGNSDWSFFQTVSDGWKSVPQDLKEGKKYK
jgi:hypothetical protein